MADEKEEQKFNLILDTLVALANGTKRLEVTKTYKHDSPYDSNIVTEERTIYRVINNG